MLKSIRNVTIILLLVKIIGFVKQAFIAAYFGATGDTDIYLLVTELMENLGEVLFSSISVTFLTIYADVSVSRGKEEKERFASNVMLLGIPCVIALGAAIFVFAGALGKVIAPGYAGEEFITLVSYIRTLAFCVVMMFIAAVCRAILDAEKFFTISKLEGLIKSTVTILGCVLLSKALGAYVLILSVIAYYVLTDLYLLISVWKKAELRLHRPQKDDRLKKLIVLSAPLFISNGSVYLHDVIDKAIGSTLDAGSISALSYGGYLTNTIHSIVIGSVCTVMFSYFSTYVAEKKDEEIKRSLNSGISALLLLTAYIAAMLLICASEIVTIVYGRGAFTSEAVDKTSVILVIYGIGLIFLGIRDLLMRVLYAYQANKTAMINGAAGMLLNVFLSILLSKCWGVYGIAAATAFANATIMIMSLVSVYRLGVLGRGDIRDLLLAALRLAVIAAICVATLYLTGGLTARLSLLPRFFIKGASGSLIFAVCLIATRNREFALIIEMLKRRIKRESE